jgi:arginine decarboxylase
LTSFELALRNAGIASYNLVSVSSIFPPDCKLVPKVKGLSMLGHGEIVYCVLTRSETNENNRLIAASLGVAIHRLWGSRSISIRPGTSARSTGRSRVIS